MTHLLEELKKQYDIVIFDSPPLNLVTDAAVLATKADGVVLVGRAGVTNTRRYRRLQSLLRLPAQNSVQMARRSRPVRNANPAVDPL